MTNFLVQETEGCTKKKVIVLLDGFIAKPIGLETKKNAIFAVHNLIYWINTSMQQFVRQRFAPNFKSYRKLKVGAQSWIVAQH